MQFIANETQKFLLDMAERLDLRIFIETGTGAGDTTKAMYLGGQFKQMHTVDLTWDIGLKCKRRCHNNNHVHCWKGDSAVRLPDILRRIHEPALFWLDARPDNTEYVKAKGRMELPVLKELEAVLSHRTDHVVCIGDASFYETFGKRYKQCPQIKDIEQVVKEACPDWDVEVTDNVICCCRHRVD